MVRLAGRCEICGAPLYYGDEIYEPSEGYIIDDRFVCDDGVCLRRFLREYRIPDREDYDDREI